MPTDVDYDSRIPSIVVELPEKLDRDQMAIARRIADGARQRAPRLNAPIITDSFIRTPGILAASVHPDDLEGEAVVFAHAFYAHYLEFGTENMRARPFLQPAAVVEEPELIGQVKHTLERL